MFRYVYFIVCDETNDQGSKDQGSKDQGSSDQGSKDQGSSDQGSKDQGSSDQGSSDQGSKDQGSKTYTQLELDNIIFGERNRQKDQNRKLLSELENLRKTRDLSKQDRVALEERIKDLQTSVLTKDELTEKTEKELITKHEKEIIQATKERNEWENRFKGSMIDQELVGAAANANAFNVEQIKALLKPKTKVIEKDGNLIPVTSITVTEDGKTKIVEVPVLEAVECMKKDTKNYGNLFKSPAKSGVGSSGNVEVPEDLDIASMSMEQYEKHREALLNK